MWQQRRLSPAALPRSCKRSLPIADDGASYFYYEVTPWPPGLTCEAELVGKADATDECNLSIDEHELPMVTEEVVQPLSQVHDVVHPELDAGVDQAKAIGLYEPKRSKAVKHETYADTTLGRPNKSVDEPARHSTGLHQVHLEQNVGLCVIDRLDHAFEILLSGLEQAKLISLAPRPVANGRISRDFRWRRHAPTMTERHPPRLERIEDCDDS